MAITVSIFLLSVPSYGEWMAKVRIRNTAESINMAILQARSEAIKLNSVVSFNLNADTSWNITDINTNSVLNYKPSSESSSNISLTILPTDSTKLTFNGFGLLTENPDGTSHIRKISANSSVYNEVATPLSVIIGTGGSSIVCDSSITTITDFRYCRAQ